MYEWNKYIKNLLKKGVYNKEFWYPANNLMDTAWNVYFSERSYGKTTALLLLGLEAYVSDEIITHYVREYSDMISASKIKDMYSTIIKLGYISKITSGKWNSITYQVQTRRWYLCNVDADGNIINQDNQYCTYNMALDMNYTYKSSYQCDKAHLVIFDEFISNRYRKGVSDYVIFCDLLYTLFRTTTANVRIFLLSNSIDRNSEYFDDMLCREFIDTCSVGDSYTYTVEKTNFYIEYVGGRQSKAKKNINARIFGVAFHNSRLNALVGSDWATNNYPHINKKVVNYLLRNVFVKVNNKYLQLDIVEVEEFSHPVVYVHKANEPTKEDRYIYTNDVQINDGHYIHGFGVGNNIDKWLKRAYENGWFYFSSNNDGSTFEHFIRSI